MQATAGFGEPVLPRRFALIRQVDYSGVSSTGAVAFGVAFADGQLILRWTSRHPATSIWSSLDDLLAVHGGDETSVEWIDTPYGDIEEIPTTTSTGRRGRRRAAETTPEPGREDQAERRPLPAPRDASRATPIKPPTAMPDPPSSQPVAVTRTTNGRAGSDTAPLLLQSVASADGDAVDAPSNEQRLQPTEPASRRPGRHRRPARTQSQTSR